MNTQGKILRLTSFGESHGKAIGGILDGFPSGIAIDMDFISTQMRRRRPGQSRITTPRKEKDKVEILSGVFEGKSTGTPLAFVIQNEDAQSKDYSHIATQFRPSHADYTYEKKYGFRDYRGGGRSSARETAVRVVAGALAQLFLRQKDIQIHAYVSQVGNIATLKSYKEMDFTQKENIVRCPDAVVSKQMISLIEEVRDAGDTIGGVVSGVIQGLPVGLGEPVFDKFHAELGKAMLGINAVKGFDYGSGFDAVAMRGSSHNDIFYNDEAGRVRTQSNYSGGVQGGITNGEDVYFRVAFKPVATLMNSQKTIDNQGNSVQMEGKGRHDPCVVPRAVPIVEAMAALVVLDFYLLASAYR
ncbi:MAG: chorismate synthase [Bernardetiaceae bacterium]|nr:chorismate synthase [Bernardetiaceae bacterium]